jgi:thiamine biosynthesis protein ThiS
MKIMLNKKSIDIPENISIMELLQLEDIVEPVTVEVFINKKQIPFEQYERVKIKENDEVEYLYLFASG